MSGKESRKNDNGNADDNPEHDGNGPPDTDAALILPPTARNLLLRKGKKAPSWPNYESSSENNRRDP